MRILKSNWEIILIVLLSILVIWPVFLPGYFFHHDDLQVMRIFEMRRCFADLQIPCRWVPDMGLGNGFPLFNYYGVLPYYIGGILSYFLGFIGAAKSLFLIPLVVGGLTMFVLGKEIFGRAGGLVTAIFYLFAPYRALDSYVRGAIAESFALALAPLMFYASLKVIRAPTWQNIVFAAISIGLFLLSHNLMTMIFIPTLILWAGCFVYIERLKTVKQFAAAFILGVGLASFFIVPAFFEQKYVQAENLVSLGSDFRGHFVSINQLFLDRSWGYGSSEFGVRDSISFQIGWPHWWLVIVSGLLIIFIRRKDLLLFGFLIMVFLGAVFMSHGRSAFLWENLPFLGFMQFPWRFLSLSIFSGSLIGGFVTYKLLGQAKFWFVLIVLVLTVFLNWSYFRPGQFYYNLTDEEKLSGDLFVIQQQAGILDYLPKTAQEPKSPRPEKPEVISGIANVEGFEVRSNKFWFDVNILERANIEVPVFDFPGWRVMVNGEGFNHTHMNKLGRIRLDLEPGKYLVTARFTDTNLRLISNLISLVSLIGILVLIVYGKIRKVN